MTANNVRKTRTSPVTKGIRIDTSISEAASIMAKNAARPVNVWLSAKAANLV